MKELVIEFPDQENRDAFAEFVKDTFDIFAERKEVTVNSLDTDIHGKMFAVTRAESEVGKPKAKVEAPKSKSGETK